MRCVLAAREGRPLITKPTQTEHKRESPLVSALYRDEFGPNLQVNHPWTGGGIAHSKMMIIEYGDCIVVMITTSNLIEIDLSIADNVSAVDRLYKMIALLIFE
jgi:hypothetical protein